MARFLLIPHGHPRVRAGGRTPVKVENDPGRIIVGVDAMRLMPVAGLGAAVAAALILACALPACAAARGLDYVIIVDCTGTMCYQGRSDATVAAVRNLVKSMQPEDRVTVYGYGEGARALFTAYPALAGDDRSRDALANSIQFTFGDDRTDITAGLELAWNERDRTMPATNGRRRGCVILLTDGKLIPVYDDYSRYEAIHAASQARLGELARLFGTLGVPVHTVGLGKAENVDGPLLTSVASASGGEYFHSPSSQALAGVFAKVAAKAADLRASLPEAAGDGATAAAGNEPGAGATPAQREHRQGESLLAGVAAAAGRPSAYPGMLYQGITAALGVLMGTVVIGMRRRQSWTNVFTKSIGREPARVRGFLKPAYPEGVTLARACVPLENPGHVCVKLGSGGDFLQELVHTAVEIVGTSSGTPLLRVVTGTVTVDGEPVNKVRKLVDGDMIEVEGRRYVYLRGSRR
jgi:Mg-chelatase subunit ChlD